MLFTKDTNRISIIRPLWFRQLATQTPFLIFPGDTIHIVVNKIDKVLLQTKTNQRKNNELIFFSNLIEKTGMLQRVGLDSFFIKAKNIQEVFALSKNILDRKDIREQLLREQLQKKNISNEFYQDANSLIQYTAISNELYLILANQELLTQKKIVPQFI